MAPEAAFHASVREVASPVERFAGEARVGVDGALPPPPLVTVAGAQLAPPSGDSATPTG